MTKLVPGRTVARETGEFERTHPIVVELHVRGLGIRLKGKPSGGKFFVSYSAVLDLARKLAHRETMAARRSA